MDQQKNKQAPEAAEETAGTANSAEGAAVQNIEAAYYSVVSATAPDGRVLIGQDIEIFPDRPRPDLASFGTEAFEARDRRSVKPHFALLCSPASLPRVTGVGSYRALKSPHVLRLVEAGIVDWGHGALQRFAMVFEAPEGKKVVPSPESPPYRLAEDRIVEGMIKPALSALADLHNAEMVHGAINCENLFMTGVPGTETLMLGECLSSAASLRQGAVYETLERAMAQTSGRGPGSGKDDLYALGVCVAMVARGTTIMAGMTAHQIVQEKMENGSYLAIVGHDRLPVAVAEFLRGVLSDDDGQRWNIDDALRWLDGRRLSSRQPRPNFKASRPFTFMEQKLWSLRAAAMEFGSHIAEAAAVVGKDQFDLWVKRNFEDKVLFSRLDKIRETEQESNRERLVSSVCMALDPAGPVRYRHLALFPGGFGVALALAMSRDEEIQSYGDLLTQQMFHAWIYQRYEEIAEASTMIALFEKCRNYLTQKMPGYGIERVLYVLSSEVACMSPYLKDFFVLSPGGILTALESLSRRPARPDQVLDRHMIAFISVREPKMIDPHLGHVISHDPGYHVVGVLRTLAAIQQRFAIGPVPGVMNWMISAAGPAIDRFRDRDLRQEISKGVSQLGDSGNLAQLLELLDDPRLIQEDAQRFVMARREYLALSAERENIDGALKRRGSFGRASGRQAAMILSSVLSIVVIAGYVVMRFSGGLL